MSTEQSLPTAPPINEAVGLLHKFAPTVLQQLQKEFPELQEHLEPGGIAGPADPLVVSRAKFCLKTLREIDRLCNSGITEAQKRLKRQKQFALIGSATAAFASASVVVSLSASYSGVAMAAGVVSLLGSLAAVFADHVGRVPQGDISLFDAYKELVVIRSDAKVLGSEIGSYLDAGPRDQDEQEIGKLVGQSNVLFRRANVLLTVLEIAGTK